MRWRVESEAEGFRWKQLHQVPADTKVPQNQNFWNHFLIIKKQIYFSNST